MKQRDCCPYVLVGMAVALCCAPETRQRADESRAASLASLHQATAPAEPATPAEPAAPAEPAPARPTPPARGGYWLSVDLVGPAAGQQAATAPLSEGLSAREPVEAAPPGILVGYVAQVDEAIEWIARHAFGPSTHLPADERALNLDPAPIPGGAIEQEHGVVVAAFVVSGATTELRPRTIEWPVDQATIVPPHLEWLPAATVPRAAPLFAAPAPRLPPASERYAMARRRGGLFVLGWFDRCADDRGGRRCMRWAQVVTRDHDRFTPGYLPMAQVAVRDHWVQGEAPLPRAQLIATGIDRGSAQWLLLARGIDNQLHRRTLHAPSPDDRWPSTSLQLEGEEAVITLGDAPPLRLRLDASLDARPPKTQEEPAPDPP